MIDLDGTKIGWYKDRVEAWNRGERIAPITVDMALTRACNFKCVYCYSKLQENTPSTIRWEHLKSFAENCREIGVKGVSIVSDGESTLHKDCFEFIALLGSLNIASALGTNGYFMSKKDINVSLQELSYLRFNISAGTPARYAEIMGVSKQHFYAVIHNIADTVKLKRITGSNCTIGMQMVFMPSFIDQVIPLTKLAIQLGVDYLIIKHCSDDELGSLGVDYTKYEHCYEVLKTAEALSTPETQIAVKWKKIKEGNCRSYQRCYAPPFHLQISGSGLVAPCGMLFGNKYEKYHIGNITKASFKDIVRGDKYWNVMEELASPKFNAQTMCGYLCLQHATNKWLDHFIQERSKFKKKDRPEHVEFL